MDKPSRKHCTELYNYAIYIYHLQAEYVDEAASTKDAGGRRRSVQSISQLGNALSSEKLDPSAKVRIVWPKEKCKMLGEEVVIIDSPGNSLCLANFFVGKVNIQKI